MAAGIERVAAADAPDAFGHADDYAVLLNRADEVRTACWMETALRTKQRADEFLVETYQPNQDVAR